MGHGHRSRSQRPALPRSGLGPCGPFQSHGHTCWAPAPATAGLPAVGRAGPEPGGPGGAHTGCAHAGAHVATARAQTARRHEGRRTGGRGTHERHTPGKCTQAPQQKPPSSEKKPEQRCEGGFPKYCSASQPVNNLPLLANTRGRTAGPRPVGGWGGAAGRKEGRGQPRPDPARSLSLPGDSEGRPPPPNTPTSGEGPQDSPQAGPLRDHEHAPLTRAPEPLPSSFRGPRTPLSGAWSTRARPCADLQLQVPSSPATRPRTVRSCDSPFQGPGASTGALQASS